MASGIGLEVARKVT